MKGNNLYMNKVILSILFLLNLDLLSNSDIDLKIQQIQNASAEDRVKLMNAFKKELKLMNENKRINAIKAFQSKQNINHTNLKSKHSIQNNAIQDSLKQTQHLNNIGNY